MLLSIVIGWIICPPDRMMISAVQVTNHIDCSITPLYMSPFMLTAGQVRIINRCKRHFICKSQQEIVAMLFHVIQEVCYQYWPSRGSQRFGEFTVEVLGEEALQSFVLRTLSVQHSKVSPQLMLRRNMTEYFLAVR